MRLTTNPGLSFTLTGVLPSSRVSSWTLVKVSSEVCNALMISTNAIIGTGLKKCMPITLSGLLLTEASFVSDSDDVLEAIMVSGPETLSISSNRSSLRAMFSVAASMTRSQSARSDRLVVVLIFRIAASFASAVIFSRSTSLCRLLSIVPRPRLVASSDTSCMTMS